MSLWQHLTKRPSAAPEEALEDLESILTAPTPALEAPLHRPWSRTPFTQQDLASSCSLPIRRPAVDQAGPSLQSAQSLQDPGHLAASCPDLRGGFPEHHRTHARDHHRQSSHAEQQSAAGASQLHPDHVASPTGSSAAASAANMTMPMNDPTFSSPPSGASGGATSAASQSTGNKSFPDQDSPRTALHQSAPQLIGSRESVEQTDPAGPEQQSHAQKSGHSCSASKAGSLPLPSDMSASPSTSSPLLASASSAEQDLRQLSPSVPTSHPDLPGSSAAGHEERFIPSAAGSSPLSPILPMGHAVEQVLHQSSSSEMSSTTLAPLGRSPAKQDKGSASSSPPSAIAGLSASPPQSSASPAEDTRPLSASNRAASVPAPAYGLLPDPRSFIGQLQQQGEGIYRVATQWQSLSPWARRSGTSLEAMSGQQNHSSTQEIQLQQQGLIAGKSREMEALLGPSGDGDSREGPGLSQPECTASSSCMHSSDAGLATSWQPSGSEVRAADTNQAAQLVQAWLDPRGWHRSTVAASVVGAAAGGAMAGPMGMSLGAKTGVLAIAAGGAIAGAAQQYCKTGTWIAPTLQPSHADPAASGEQMQNVLQPIDQLQRPLQDSHAES